MKKIQEMTEEEVLNYVARAIHDYLMRIRPQHGEFVLESCMSWQINELRRLYRLSLGLGGREKVSPAQARELEMTIQHYLPGMQEQALAVQLHYTKEQTLWKIRGTSAEALIKKAFADEGIEVSVDSQRYRAKVIACLGSYSLRFYVGFKALENEDTLPGVIRAAIDMKDALTRLGRDVKVSR